MTRIFKWLIGTVVICAGAFGISWGLSMPQEAQRGAWKSETGGMILNVTQWRATAFRQSSVSCLETVAFPTHMQLIELLEGATIETVSEQLSLSIDGSLEPTLFDRLPSLPADCKKADPATATAAQTFDAFWAAMNEHYAFFDLHGVDWNARRALAPAPNASDADLAAAMLAAAEGLDDGHVHFGTDGNWHSPAKPPAWMVDYENLNRPFLSRTAQSASGATIARHAAAPIIFGMRPDGIGYIQIIEMDIETAFGEKLAPAAARAFDQVLSEISDAKSLIIDVRYNPGGSDSVAFGIASHFAETAVPVFSKSSRAGDGQGTAYDAVLEPFDTTPNDKPVILLTSNLTGSSAEIFTLAMKDLPQVTVMGEPTSGGLSDVLGFTLPNGWSLGLSNQTYIAADGNLYEGVGIPPDVPARFDGASLSAGQDSVLAAAISLADL
jgi:carboxyl-terminal processing protease